MVKSRSPETSHILSNLFCCCSLPKTYQPIYAWYDRDQKKINIFIIDFILCYMTICFRWKSIYIIPTCCNYFAICSTFFRCLMLFCLQWASVYPFWLKCLVCFSVFLVKLPFFSPSSLFWGNSLRLHFQLYSSMICFRLPKGANISLFYTIPKVLLIS